MTKYYNYFFLFTMYESMYILDNIFFHEMNLNLYAHNLNIWCVEALKIVL
jgi:hypothetical protein